MGEQIAPAFPRRIEQGSAHPCGQQSHDQLQIVLAGEFHHAVEPLQHFHIHHFRIPNGSHVPVMTHSDAARTVLCIRQFIDRLEIIP